MSNAFIIFLEYLTVFLYPLGQISRISFFNQQANIYPYEVVMGVTVIVLLVKYNLELFKTTFLKSIWIFLVVLGLLFVLTLFLYNLQANLVGFLYLLRLILYYVYFIVTFVHLRHDRRIKTHLFKQLCIIILLIAGSSIFQYIFFPNLRSLLYEGWDPHLYRVFSFYFEPYLAGGAIGMSLFFVYFRVFHKKTEKYLRWLVLTILFVLLMLTFSRTVYLSAMVTVILLFLKEKKYKLIGLVVCAFIILAIIIPKPIGVGVQLYRTFSINTRVTNAFEGVSLWLKSPVVGIGYNRIRYRKAQLGLIDVNYLSHAVSGYHSSFIIMLVSGGAIGFLLFLFVLCQLAKISPLSFFIIYFLSILSIGDNALLHPFILFFLFKIIAFESVAHSSLE